MAASKDAPSFDDIIQARRKREQNEALANKLLGKARRTSAPGLDIRKPTVPGGTLASRMGITKQRSTSALARPASNINGKWSHDLHQVNNPRARAAQAPRPLSSAPRIERTTTRIYNELRANQPSEALSTQAHIRSGATNGVGISIKGAAGPYTVIASNFAPGTTAADIESVMASVGGEMLSCRLISSHPTVIAEMVFTHKDGAENVIETFNNKKADGRLLYVYLKNGPPAQPFVGRAAALPRSPVRTPSAPRSGDRDLMEVEDDYRGRTYSETTQATRSKRAEPEYQDGRYGFSEYSTQEKRAVRDERREDRRDDRLDDRMGYFSDQSTDPRPRRDEVRLYSDGMLRRERNYRR